MFLLLSETRTSVLDGRFLAMNFSGASGGAVEEGEE